MTLSASAAPGENFGLTNWKLTLPIDGSGGFGGTAVEVKDLSTYQHPKYFFTATDGAMVFNAPVDGATTSGSRYARSELREMNGSERAAWNLDQGGFMAATLEVDQAPTKSDGSPGRVIVGQIHGQNEELVRLYWDKGSVYFHNDQAGASDAEMRFDLLSSSGSKPSVSLDERFSYTIDAKGDALVVKVLADGQTYTSSTKINAVWDADAFYFKAGAYLGVNETQGNGAGQTSFYALSFNHNGTVTAPATTDSPRSAPEASAGNSPLLSLTGGTADGLSAPATTPKPISSSDGDNDVGGTTDSLSWPTTTTTVSGSDGDNDIVGTSGNDDLRGNGEDDEIWGRGGSDVLTGGSGLDTFTFDTQPSSTNIDVITDFNVADDTIHLDNAVFSTLRWGDLAPSAFVLGDKAGEVDDRVIYNSSTGVLSYDADGSGPTDALPVAHFHNLPKLTAADIAIV